MQSKVSSPHITFEFHEPLKLNIGGLNAAKLSLEQGAITPSYGPWREDIVRLLNDSLATELVCALRYKRHYFTAAGLASSKIANDFLVHASEETRHADRLAARIVQLGGDPDFSPDFLSKRSYAPYNAELGLKSMIKANLSAERLVIEAYTQMIALIGDKDPVTTRLIEDILSQEYEHADKLKKWLVVA